MGSRRKLLLFLMACCAFASFVSAQTVSITFLDDWGAQTSRVLENGRALLRVIDPAADVTPGPDSVSVELSSITYMDSGFTDLHETGDSTGVFEGEMDLTTDFYQNYLNDDDLLFTVAGGYPLDTVQAGYNGAGASAEAAPSLTDLLEEDAETSPASFASGERVRVRVRDKWADAYAGQDSTQATITASGGDSETLVLPETGGRTAVFETSIRLAAGAAVPQDGLLQAAPGETLTVTHADSNGFSSSSDTAGVTAASVRFVDRREGRSTDVYVESSEVVVRIVDPAANADPGAFDTVAVTLYRSSDVEPLTVRETGTSTGVFEGRMRLRVYSAIPGDGYLEPSPPSNPPVTDQVGVAYGSLTDTATIVQSLTRLLDEQGEPVSSIALGETVRVRVEAANGLGSGAADSVQVHVRSLTTGDEEVLVLWETEGQSWLFEGDLQPVSGAAAPGDGRLQAQPGETLEAEHHDVYNVPASSALAAVVRSRVRFVDEDGRPTSLLLEDGTALLEILDLLSAGQTPPAAGVSSYLAQDAETVALSETGEPGLFAGSIPMGRGYWASGNGVLDTTYGTYPVGHPDTVTAESNGATAEAITAPALLDFVDGEGNPLETSTAGAPASLRLVSHRANASPTAPDTGYATLRTTRSGDMEYVTLVETGPDTAVFLGSVPTLLSNGYGDPNGLLTLRARDSVSVSYYPPGAQSEDEQVTDHLAIVPVRVELLDAAGEGVAAYLFDETVHLRVSEPGANADPGSAETVAVQVRAWRRTDDKADVETVVLTETGADTGVFEGQLDMQVMSSSTFPLWDNALLEVPDAVPPQGDLSIVTATRGEASDSAVVKDSVLRFTDAAGNDVERVRVGTTVHIRLRRPVSSTTPGVDTETVTVWTHTGYAVDFETVTLSETGGSTGLFTGSIPTAPAPFTTGNGILEGGGGTVIEVDKDANSARRSFDFATLTQEANQPPNAVNDVASGLEDTALSIAVRSNDVDPNGDALSITAVTQGTQGTVAIGPSGTVTYTPGAGWSGADSFTYTVADPDGLTDTATVAVTINPVNDPPVAVDDTATTRQGVSVVVPVLANDTDPDGDTLGFAWLGINGNGTWSVNPDGTTLTYTPNVSFTGTDTYTYGVRDTGSPYLTDEATVTVTVTPNIPPNAVDDTVNTNEDTPVTIDLRLNDTDAEGDPLTVTGTSQPNRGSVAINANGTVTYTPTANHSGFDLFVYTLSDGHGGTDTAVVSVNVAPVNDVPDAVADFKSTPEDTPATITVLSNDTDRDGDALTVTAVTQPAKGTVVINANNTVTFTPDLNKNGSDLFSYTISDGNGGTDTANVSLTISPVNDPPVAVADAVTVAENGTATFSVIANDTDPENSTLRVTAVTQGAHGTVTILAGYQLRYQPAAGYFGPDTFTYTLADPGNLTSTGTVSVTVTPINDPPVAAADTGATNEDTPVTLSVLANDSDPDQDALTVSAVTQAASGSVTTNGTTVTFSPAANVSGTATFTYTVRDPAGAEATASVTVTINAVNDAPAAAADGGSTRENVSVILAVLANDTDIEGNPLTVTATSTPPNGVTARLADDTVRYTPHPNFTGTETFTYTVSDGQGGTSVGQVVVTVGEALERVAVLATNSVALRTGSDVLSGDVIVNQAGAGPFLNAAELSVGGSVTTASGWDVEGDSVTVAAGAVVSGDVLSNQLTNSGTIQGQQGSPLALPVFSTLPAFLAATPGSTTINVANNATQTLAAGSYQDLVVGRKGTVTLTGGTYHFRSIRIDREAKLYVSAASVIRVQQKLSTKNLTVVGPAPGASIDASSIVFHVGGINGTGGGLAETPKAVEIGVDNTLNANVYAPNGTIWLQDRTQATGAFLGKDVDVAVDVQVNLDSAFSGGQ